MAYLWFLLPIMICFATTEEAGAKHSGNYEELIYQSMKSIVSLDELVTTLSIQVARLTTSLSSMQVNVEQVEKRLEKVNERVTNESAKTAKVTAALKSSGADLKHNVENLKTSIANINAKVEKANKEVVVVSGETSNGHEKCVKVCAGTTGRDTTNWKDFSSMGVYLDVDITSCGFIKVPTVTTSIEGADHHWMLTGTSSIYNVQPSAFRIYLNSNLMDPRNGAAKRKKWNVEWIAVGFTC